MSAELVYSVTADTSTHYSHHPIIRINEFSDKLADANLDGHANEIVAALGGIHQILNEYIRISTEYETEELLKSVQMQHISDLISDNRAENALNAVPNDHENNINHTFWDKMYSMAKLKDDTFHLSRSGTLLHSIISTRYGDYVDRLVAWPFSKYALMTLVIVTFPLIGLSLLMGDDSHWFLSVWLIIQIIFILYLSLCILSCNKPIFYLVLSGFDFWVKIGYGIAAAICYIIYIRAEKTDSSSIQVVVVDVGAVSLVFVIVMVSLMEGYVVNWKLSFLLGLIMSLFISYQAIQLTLFSSDREDVDIRLSTNVTFGILEFLASAMRVLSLFFWKQTLMTAYTRGEWCICVYLTPQIKWDAAKRDEDDQKRSH